MEPVICEYSGYPADHCSCDLHRRLSAATALDQGAAPLVGTVEMVSRLERRVKYYERMHAEARRALDIAADMSLEMKERLIEARQELARAKLANGKAETRAP